jgi:hypothetical protein
VVDRSLRLNNRSAYGVGGVKKGKLVVGRGRIYLFDYTLILSSLFIATSSDNILHKLLLACARKT